MAEAKIDRVIEIKDKAEQLRRYAIRRNDPDLKAAMSAVALRTHYQIGVISRDLETAKNQYAPPPVEGAKLKLSKPQVCRMPLPSGEQAGTLVTAREARKARDQAANGAQIAAAAEGAGSIDARRGDFRAVR